MHVFENKRIILLCLYPHVLLFSQRFRSCLTFGDLLSKFSVVEVHNSLNARLVVQVIDQLLAALLGQRIGPALIALYAPVEILHTRFIH